MIGLIGAMDVEVERLRALMENPVTETVSGADYIRGSLMGQEVVLARSGIGKVFAAICAQTMILRYGVTTIVNSGVAGTLTEALHIGDVAVSTECVQHDMDTTAVGDPAGLLSGSNIVRLPCSAEVARQFDRVCCEQEINHRLGLIATGDQFVSSQSRRTWIGNTFEGAIAVEMEAGAIAQVCYVNRVPFVSLRVISDEATGNASIDFPTFVKAAAKTSSDITLAWLKSLNG